MNLSDLEAKAAEILGNFMGGFDAGISDKIICCPWLNWRKNLLFERKWDGILLMQDWGNESQSLEDAIKNIANGNGDSTIKSLCRDSWKSVIWGSNPTWLVTNAVWGVRIKRNQKNKVNKCGYLGDDIYAKAFQIWAAILADAAKRNKKLKVVFAGSWARFDNDSQNSMNLKGFLENWKNWCQKVNRNLQKSDLEFLEEIS